MKTGFKGAFVISWSQTEVDGQSAAFTDTLSMGMAWRWSGQTIRVDGPGELLLLDGANGAANLRKKAARTVRRLVGVAMQPRQDCNIISVDNNPVMDNGFVVTDGRRTFTVSIIELDDGVVPLLMFLNEMPPVDTDMWVVSNTVERRVHSHGGALSGGVICFTSGTKILTPNGARLVQDLVDGDKIQTKDDGAQEILWIGKRRMTGARLHAMPHLRPIRIKAGAFCAGEPDEDLLVSPDHRLLIKGAAASALFNTSEVLVAAKDLVDGQNVQVDYNLHETQYIHLMLAGHQIVWANGVETESFHPANTMLDTIHFDQRARLFALSPELQQDPHTYGDYARRNLSPSEAEILKYDVNKFRLM